MENHKINKNDYTTTIVIRSWLATVEELPETIKCNILRETDQAIEIETKEKNFPFWLPKSQIKIITQQQTTINKEENTLPTIEQALQQLGEK